MSPYTLTPLYSFVSIKCFVRFGARKGSYLKSGSILGETVADWNADSASARKQLL